MILCWKILDYIKTIWKDKEGLQHEFQQKRKAVFFKFPLYFFLTATVLKSKPNISSETRTEPCELLVIQLVAVLVWITSEKNTEQKTNVCLDPKGALVCKG